MSEKRIKIRACRQCGAVVTVAADDGGVDNEQGHAEWHERQDELLAQFQEMSEAFGTIAVTYWTQVCVPFARSVASAMLPKMEALGEAIKRAQGDAEQAPEEPLG